MTIPKEVINWSILNEIISMDEDDPGFSKGLIIQFLEQASNTFEEMEVNVQQTRDLKKLDSLGHFLKGSSAALGLQSIAWVCERIQNLGRKKESGFSSTEDLGSMASSEDVTEDDAVYLDAIEKALVQARHEFSLVREELSEYYHCEL
ncbi:hypothetical protein HG535_0D00520 [Zygotorulaspora mrakii]|uniref:HPt domain-containing protein n=1 Tax=Zygotorulaspora mrakii TaxID=42260 RepID=A0A7H9B0Z1_ZYGMR|nr:uncharacterized protein HG535_0D00520 [Zygotorulaspora mrakii]QLG72345.1 hypothetical protein HG535_0D00520 [Zygotorulaspora mrakii]